MAKQKWKAGNMVYPLPVVMISCGTEEKPNIVTVAWTGTICTNPPMTYISLRPSRYSYNLIAESGYFVINLTTRDLTYATDFCGVRSGRDVDKFKEMALTPNYDNEGQVPMIEESPVNIVCKVREIKQLGSHDLFIADVLEVYVDDAFMDEKGKFHLNDTDLVAYSHGTYLTLGDTLGTFGYSVMKPKKGDKQVAQLPQPQEKEGQSLAKHQGEQKCKPQEKSPKAKTFKNKKKTNHNQKSAAPKAVSKKAPSRKK
ncbi:MAG: flavin reductase family protein, partial [Niameybacter sp.]|uniref:flavin reductase family protein n=1 Tax=Niameybacter sp. TaxID=2033640 RepID=UPI002FC7E0DE